MGNGVDLVNLFGKAMAFSSGDEPVRKPEDVGRILQLIINQPDCGASLLDAPKQAMLVSAFPQELWVPEAERYYREVFGRQVNLLPVLKAATDTDKHAEFCWPTFMMPEVAFNRIWSECRNHYPASSYYGDDLERAVRDHQRTTANGPYMARFRARVEADEENKNLSANELAKQGGKYITLPERLMLGDFIWWLTGGFHLDLLNWTLCAGSRGRGGYVPCVRWDGSGLRVNYYHPGPAGDYVRARSAV
ncbi:MAG: hypothetical protein HY980_00335 [Candidatus Magasanikbacteria bacterium]|nr:hypothetical protein [Candidatus Magasanikbacteria bacterium]